MIFIGPSPLAGIGQVVNKYAKLFGTKYYVLGQDPIPTGRDVFMFALPIPRWLEAVPKIKEVSKRVICMTICETETVHPDYGKLFDLFDEIAVASEFCKRVFERQFPGTRFYIIRVHVPQRTIRPLAIDFGLRPDAYKFYHIGNVVDQRKNIKQVIEAFYRCNFDNAQLVIKATCNSPVTWNMPNVVVINGLIQEDHLDQLHLQCDCYVSASYSEGVGMGAIEAALHDKPVIITSYGGAVEYVRTPYTVQCGLQKLPCDDFLFQKGMEWGKPDFDQLKSFMRDAYDMNVKYMEHPHTKSIVSRETVLEQFGVDVVGQVDDEADQDGAGHEEPLL